MNALLRRFKWRRYATSVGTYLVDKGVVNDSVVANNGVHTLVAVEAL